MSRAQVLWSRHGSVVRFAAVVLGLLAMAVAGGAPNAWPTQSRRQFLRRSGRSKQSVKAGLTQRGAMLVLFAGMFGLVVGQARGGRLLNLADLKVRGWGLIVIALVAELLVVLWLVPDQRVPVMFDGALLLGSYAALLIVVWQNRMLAGMGLLGVGILLNVVAAVPHGGFDPTTPETLQIAGRPFPVPLPGPGERPFVQSKDIVLPQDQIPFWPISDRFAVPHGWPLSGVFSPGDVLIALGLGWVLEQGMLTQPVTLGFVASK